MDFGLIKPQREKQNKPQPQLQHKLTKMHDIRLLIKKCIIRKLEQKWERLGEKIDKRREVKVVVLMSSTLGHHLICHAIPHRLIHTT